MRNVHRAGDLRNQVAQGQLKLIMYANWGGCKEAFEPPNRVFG